MQYPKLVIITSEDAFKVHSSASFTIRSFLKDWPSDSIFQIVCGDFNLGEEKFARDNCYVLGHHSIRVASWVIKSNREGKSALSTGQLRNLYAKDSIMSSIKNFVKGAYQLLPYRLPNSLVDALEFFKPEIIYSSAVDYRGVLLTNRLSKLFRIPAMPHFMDDWPSIYLSSSGQKKLKLFFERELRTLFRNAPFYFCICDYMSDTYKRRYGNPNAVSLMNSVSSQRKHKEKNKNAGKIWLYAGSLYLKRYDSLIRIADSLATEGRTEDKIFVYCPKDQWDEMSSSFREYPQIKYGGFISQDDLMVNIAQADFLLFIETFDEEMLTFTRYSMSTKIPEYLSSGNPILAVGNPKQGSIRYLLDNNGAYVATQSNMIQDKIRDIVRGYNLQQILSNAEKLFVNNHTQESQVLKFKGVVERVLQAK